MIVFRKLQLARFGVLRQIARLVKGRLRRGCLGEYRCTSEDKCGRESSRNKGFLDHAIISFGFERISLRTPLPQREVQYLSTEVRRSEEHTSELESLMRISYAVFCLKKKKDIL